MLADEKEIKMQAEIDDCPMVIRGEKTHLRRLFFNLLNNAIKFTYPGGKITLSLRREDHTVLAQVADTGIGIPEENLPKIFDKFFHFNGTGLDVPPGNGLGLSIAQSIVKAHSGEISVKSKAGEGTVFTVKLPLAP